MRLLQKTLITFLFLISFSLTAQVLEIREASGTLFYSSAFPTSHIRIRHIEAVNDLGPTSVQFEIKIGNLVEAPGTNMNIVIIDAVTGSPVAVIPVSVNSVPGYNNMITTGSISASTFAGSYGYKTYGVGYGVVGSGATVFQRQFFTIERTTLYNNTILGMPFKIHYADGFFTHPGTSTMNTYVTDLKNSIRESWQKEVIDWGLCAGVLAQPTGGSAADMPRDADNVYQIVIHNMGAILHGMNRDHYRAKNETTERCIIIDSDLTPLHPNGISHSENMYMLISHEFLHGIQFSHMTNIDINKRNWLIEGQARFLETVFMSNPTYNTTSTNAAYIINSLDYNYESDASRFINNIYGTTYSYPNLHDAEYQYAIFWRHLFEHHFPAGATIQTKMALLRNTIISQNTINNSVFADIEQNIFDNNLNKAGGNTFETFDEALIDFTEKLYFHDKAYNTAANRAILFSALVPSNIWDDPNPAPNDNFYSRITSFNEPVNTLAGTSFGGNFDIPSSFGHRAHKFRFQRNAGIKIEFISNPGSRPAFGDFNVDCYLLNNTSIEQKQSITLDANGNGNITINVDEPYKNIVVLVTRLDAGEGTSANYPDYKIALNELATTVGTKYSWPTPSTSTTGGLFFGEQRTIKGQFADFRNNGTTDVFCKGIEIEAPQTTKVYAIESGTAHADASSVNVGHYRYANLQNIVAGGSFQTGDLIGEVDANIFLYFLESDVPLTTAGETTTGKWINPLRPDGLSPYIDITPPIIQSITLENATGNVTAPLFGKFDIIVDAYDPATIPGGGAHASLKCGIHKITVKFKDASGVEIINSIGGVSVPTRIEYYPAYDKLNTKHELPTSSITDIYHSSASANQFVYIVTNEPYSGSPNKYWNTRQKDGGPYNIDAAIPGEALFKDGSITIEVTVEDLSGNTVTQTI